MRPTATFPLLLALAAVPAVAREPFDHYDPAVLVAAARQAMRAGELTTACVLLARAGQLAPHDARIAIAWGDYAAAQQGRPPAEVVAAPAPAPAPASAPARAAPRAPVVGPEPAPPWPVR